MWRYKGYRLPQDLGLLASVVFFLGYFSILLRIRPVKDILDGIARTRVRKDGRTHQMQMDTVLDKIWRASTFVQCRICRSKTPCLKRSLILYRCCRRRGIDASVVIGVAKDGSRIKGHSWLLINGSLYRENKKDLESFVPMLQR